MTIRIADSAPGDTAALADLIDLHEQCDGKWFTPSTMRFFASRVETGLLHGAYFVTSETPDEWEVERRFTVRSFDTEDPFMVHTVGDFQQYDSLADALAAVEAL